MAKSCRKFFFRGAAVILLLLFLTATQSLAQKLLAEPTLVHFDTASAKLSAKDVIKLKRLAARIKDLPVEMILVEGYCDRRRIVNDYEYVTNQQLSQARAYNVAVLLQNETGLPANKFTRYGYGASKMIPRSGEKTGLAANRRVEVRVFLKE